MSPDIHPPIVPLCYLCVSENTPSDQQGSKLHVVCEKCKRAYCDKHASILDPTYCQPCLNDFSVTKQDYVRAGVAVTHKMDENGNVMKDANGQIVTERRYYSTKSKQIILFGNDWLFAELRWSDMTEEQCEISLEWHRGAVSFLEQRITEHRIVKAHELAKKKVPLGTKSVSPKTVSKERKDKAFDALVSSMSGNMKKEDLAKLIAKLQQSVSGGK